LLKGTPLLLKPPSFETAAWIFSSFLFFLRQYCRYRPPVPFFRRYESLKMRSFLILNASFAG